VYPPGSVSDPALIIVTPNSINPSRNFAGSLVDKTIPACGNATRKAQIARTKSRSDIATLG
jgi:hypothetical protein